MIVVRMITRRSWVIVGNHLLNSPRHIMSSNRFLALAPTASRSTFHRSISTISLTEKCRRRRDFMGLFTPLSSRPFSNSQSTTATSQFNINKTTMMGTVAVFMGGVFVTRWWYGHTLSSSDIDDYYSRPRQDNTKVTIRLPSPQASKNVKINGNDDTNTSSSSNNTTTSDVRTNLDVVDAEKYHDFVQEQRQRLQRSKEQLNESNYDDNNIIQQTLHKHLQDAFQDCHDVGVKKFVNWYLAYPTTYKLLSLAMKSTSTHALGLSKRKLDTDVDQQEQLTLQQLVTEDIQRYICDKYQALVLRPTITNPKIHRAIQQTLQELYQEIYVKELQTIETNLHDFVQTHSQDENATNIDPPTSKNNKNSIRSTSALAISPNDIILELDWKTQLQKVQHIPLSYEKKPPELSMAMIGVGAIAGKTGGLAVAIKSIGAKLATPFASKAVVASSAGTAVGGKAAAVAASGGAIGAMGGGPIGAIAGAMAGIAVDMTVNQGVALMQRSALENDIHESLNATILEWEERLLPELQRVIQEEWYEQQLQSLLPDTTTSAANSTTTTPAMKDSN